MLHVAPDPVPTLKKRADFKRLMKGKKRTTADFTLQADTASESQDRFGFTVTRKIGTATERNRIRRRLKAAVAALPAGGHPAIDVVIVARRSCISRPFANLRAEMQREIAYLRNRVTPNPDIAPLPGAD